MAIVRLKCIITTAQSMDEFNRANEDGFLVRSDVYFTQAMLRFASSKYVILNVTA